MRRIIIFLLLEHYCHCTIEKGLFGYSKDGEAVYKYSLSNGSNLKVTVIEYGAAIQSLYVQDKYGNTDDIVLGFDDVAGYIQETNPYFGATIGRVANRIGNANFHLDGITYYLEKNEGHNTLHGGFHSLSKVVWKSEVVNDAVVMSYISPDNEGGFPGAVRVNASFQLTENNELIIRYSAQPTKRTPISLTNHAYFNLASHRTGHSGIFDHVIRIVSEKYTALDNHSLPTGEYRHVEGTGYDLRNPTLLGPAIASTPTKNGFDINYILKEENSMDIVAAACVHHPPTGRLLTVYTNQPGLQFYTGNSLSNIKGKSGVHYDQYGALCLEAQGFPDAVNHPNFPSVIINPYEWYMHTTVFKFGVK